VYVISLRRFRRFLGYTVRIILLLAVLGLLVPRLVDLFATLVTPDGVGMTHERAREGDLRLWKQWVDWLQRFYRGE